MKLFLWMAAFVPLLSACSPPTSPAAVRAEVWRGGDDGATVKFTAAVESAIYGSPRFRQSRGKKPRTLLVTVPTNVELTEVSGRNQIHYRVEFSTEGAIGLGSSDGTCWDDALSECADSVLRDAKSAAEKMLSMKE